MIAATVSEFRLFLSQRLAENANMYKSNPSTPCGPKPTASENEAPRIRNYSLNFAVD